MDLNRPCRGWLDVVLSQMLTLALPFTSTSYVPLICFHEKLDLVPPYGACLAITHPLITQSPPHSRGTRTTFASLRSHGIDTASLLTIQAYCIWNFFNLTEQ